MEHFIPVEVKQREMAISACPTIQLARRVVMTAVFLPLAVLLLIVADGLVRGGRQDQPAVQWMRHLDLAAPAFWPSGTPQRRPEALTEAVDLRMAPLAGFPGGRGWQPIPDAVKGAQQP